MHQKRLLKVATVPLLVGISIFALLCIYALLAHHSYKEYNNTMHIAKGNLKRLAQIISSNVEISFASIDQTLQRAAERQYFNMLFGKTLHNDMEHNISLWVNETPHLDAMFITDSKGMVDILYRKGKQHHQVSPGYKFSIKKHFEQHKNSEDISLLITPSNKAGSSRIFVSRRIENISGSFGGLVVAVINADYITNFLRSVEKSQGTQIAILLEDNKFLLKNGIFDEQEILLKTTIAQTRQKYGNATRIEQKQINNETHLFSFAQLHNLPIYISLAINSEHIFSDWYEKRNQYIVFASVVTIFIATFIVIILLINEKMQHIKQSEKKALLASQTKSDFLAKMSHELRTPLNAIIGFSDMLSTGYFGKVTSDQVERLSDINMCGTHLLELINGILDFSRGEVGKLHLKEELVDLDNVIIKSIRVLEQRARTRGVKLVNTVPRDINAIYADGRKIKQILINLLSNSIKFTPSGGKVVIASHFDNDYNLVITVTDTGIGIEQKDIPKALEVFEQVHNQDGSGSGTGLGLPLCEMLAEMHGGTFLLESTVDVGTKASLTIPRSRVRKPIFEEKLAAV